MLIVLRALKKLIVPAIEAILQLHFVSAPDHRKKKGGGTWLDLLILSFEENLTCIFVFVWII